MRRRRKRATCSACRPFDGLDQAVRLLGRVARAWRPAAAEALLAVDGVTRGLYHCGLHLHPAPAVAQQEIATPVSC